MFVKYNDFYTKLSFDCTILKPKVTQVSWFDCDYRGYKTWSISLFNSHSNTSRTGFSLNKQPKMNCAKQMCVLVTLLVALSMFVSENEASVAVPGPPFGKRSRASKVVFSHSIVLLGLTLDEATVRLLIVRMRKETPLIQNTRVCQTLSPFSSKYPL